MLALVGERAVAQLSAVLLRLLSRPLSPSAADYDSHNSYMFRAHDALASLVTALV